MFRLNPKNLFIAALLLSILPFEFAGIARASSLTQAAPVFTPPPTAEAWRIMIDNSAHGAIGVSIDGGKMWNIVGRVTQPAKCSLPGYLAAEYAPIGCVAASAVHGIRIRVGDSTNTYPTMFNIVPTEFAQTPNFYGGHISGDSGIYTDIPAGDSIFREFAPYVGSQVLVKTPNSFFQPSPANYSPTPGDIIEIVVRRPIDPLREVVIENVVGGDVTVTYASGKKAVVTHVVQPVQGIGRFDGCSYTGVGAINTNHTCVITVSTAPITKARELEGTAVNEKRGGFQIVPSFHNNQTEEHGAPQMLIIGTKDSKGPELEGTPPLFYGYFDLASDPSEPKHSWVCQVRTAASTNWEPMPELIGDQPDSLRKLGVIAFRISRSSGQEDVYWTRHRVDVDRTDYTTRRMKLANAGHDMIARGIIHFNEDNGLPIPLIGAAFAQYCVDGEVFDVTNNKPFDWDWDTARVADGEHVIEGRALDGEGNVLAVRRAIYWVDNMHQIVPVGGQ